MDNLGNIARASVRLDFDTSGLEKSLQDIQSKSAKVTASSTGQQASTAIAKPIKESSKLMQVGMMGAFTGVGGRLKAMNAEMRVSGQILQSSFAKSTANASKMVHHLKHISTYSQGAETRAYQQTKTERLQYLGKGISQRWNKMTGKDKPEQKQDLPTVIIKLSTAVDTLSKSILSMSSSPAMKSIASVSPKRRLANRSTMKWNTIPSKLQGDYEIAPTVPGSKKVVADLLKGKFTDFKHHGPLKAKPKSITPNPTRRTIDRDDDVTLGMFGADHLHKAWNKVAPRMGRGAKRLGGLIGKGAKGWWSGAKMAGPAIGRGINVGMLGLDSARFARNWTMRGLSSTRASAQNWMSGAKTTAKVAAMPITLPLKGIKGVIGMFDTYEAKVAKANKALGDFGAESQSVASPIEGVSKAVSGASSIFGGLSKILLGGVVAGLAAFAYAAFKGVGAAKELEKINKDTDAQWGDQSSGVKDFATELQKASGASQAWSLKTTNAFGEVFSKEGFGKEASAKMSENLTMAAQSIAGARGMGMDEASSALESGIGGNLDSLKKLGIYLDDDAVEAEAAAMGIKKVDGEYTDAGKEAATYSLVMKQVTDGHDAIALSSEAATNAQNSFYEKVQTLVTSLGESLLPGLTEAEGGFWGFANGMLEAVTPAITTVIEWITWMVGGVIDAVQTITDLITNWRLVWDIVEEYMKTFGENVVITFKWIGPAIMKVGKWLVDNWKNIVSDIGNMLYYAFINTIANIKELWGRFKAWIGGDKYESKALKGLFEGMPEYKTEALNIEGPKYKSADVAGKIQTLQDTIVKQHTEDKKPSDQLPVNAREVDAGKAANDAQDNDKKKKDKGDFIGIIEYYKKIQGSALSSKDKAKEERDKKKLGHLETIAKNSEKQPQLAVAGK